jgi:hypothetical protein
MRVGKSTLESVDGLAEMIIPGNITHGVDFGKDGRFTDFNGEICLTGFPTTLRDPVRG